MYINKYGLDKNIITNLFAISNTAESKMLLVY